MPKIRNPAASAGKTAPKSPYAPRSGGLARGVSAMEPHADFNGLLAEPRRMKILDWLQEEGSARVRDLSAAFGVSEATIRQDLEKLEIEGHINRQHGGAFLRTMPKQVETLSLQHMENIEKKRKIGAKAASLVVDGEAIIVVDCQKSKGKPWGKTHEITRKFWRKRSVIHN